MKNAIVILLALATNMAFAAPVELGREAVSVANLMRNYTAKQCLTKIELKHRAEFSIEKIVLDEVEDLTKYEISGTLLQEGDIAVGFATVQLTGSYQFPWGFAYECEVQSAKVF